ncbi:hypothetical protein F5050DRAFT_1716716, partial [Lentinula boryana]
DHANVYVSGFIRGPKEPSAVDAQHGHFLRPMVLDLQKAYSRGIRCHGAADPTTPTVPGPECTFRAMIGGACLDLKAIRPVAGLLDINSHHVCTSCNVFHQESILRTDHESWEPADDDYYRKGMQKWKEAETLKEREIIEHYYGTRYSPLEMLEYFKFSTMIIAEPMHAMYHRVLHLYFREALRLVTLDSIPPRYASNISFYHDFTHPPRPSNHVEALPEQRPQCEEYLAYLEWSDLSDDDHLLRISRLEDWLMPTMQNDIRALDDVVKGHQLLSEKRPAIRSEEKELLKRLSALRWHSLVYICNDLWLAPLDSLTSVGISKSDLQKELMAHWLQEWRSHDVREDSKFRWPHFTVHNRPPPAASWAPPPIHIINSGNYSHAELTDSERTIKMENIARQMGYESV